MNYLHGNLLHFGLRSLYRFGMSLAEEDVQKKKYHLGIMMNHIEFIQECCEQLPSLEKVNDKT